MPPPLRDQLRHAKDELRSAEKLLRATEKKLSFTEGKLAAIQEDNEKLRKELADDQRIKAQLEIANAVANEQKREINALRAQNQTAQNDLMRCLGYIERFNEGTDNPGPQIFTTP